MPVDFLKNADLCKTALDFLSTYHPDDTVPVPIEEIIEFQLGLDIIPTLDYQRNFGIEGALSGDFSGIFVDDFVQSARTNRYRFTLAHEIGHFILHKEHLEQIKPVETIDNWIDCLRSMNGKDRDYMEYQARAFAGYLLVPPHHLRACFLNQLPTIDGLISQAREANFPRASYLDFAIGNLAESLAGNFEVSPDVMAIRIRNDKLDKHIK